MTKTPKYPTNTHRDAYMSCSAVLSTAIYPPPINVYLHSVYIPANCRLYGVAGCFRLR